MKKSIRVSLVVATLFVSIGLNLNQGNAKNVQNLQGLDFFSNQALAEYEMWGVALPPYYCGCPSGVPAGCYCIVQ